MTAINYTLDDLFLLREAYLSLWNQNKDDLVKSPLILTQSIIVNSAILEELKRERTLVANDLR